VPATLTVQAVQIEFFLFHVRDAESLRRCLVEMIPATAHKIQEEGKKISLIAVDSVAAPLRELPPQQSATLLSIAASLHRHASTATFGCLITNQAQAFLQGDAASLPQLRQQVAVKGKLTGADARESLRALANRDNEGAALGLRWACGVNTRHYLSLSRNPNTGSILKRWMHTCFCPMSQKTRTLFHLGEDGVVTFHDEPVEDSNDIY